MLLAETEPGGASPYRSVPDLPDLPGGAEGGESEDVSGVSPTCSLTSTSSDDEEEWPRSGAEHRRPERDRRMTSFCSCQEAEAGPPDWKPAHGKGGLLRTLMLALGATGVVFGDIGTSPLYVFSGVFVGALGSSEPTPEQVQGIFSMIFWLLAWVVCVKYIGVVLRVSYHGEGGTFAMMQTIVGSRGFRGEPFSDGAKEAFFFMAMLGCALIVGDGCITPVISVLGALEGVGGGDGGRFVSIDVAVAVVILLLVFAAQRHGSQFIGLCSGPVVVIWFLAIGGLGIYNLMSHPAEASIVLQGLNPMKIVDLWTKGAFPGVRAWHSLSGVVLAVTGSEALYADMGHFGAGPITLAWFGLVYPCLVLQYLGQAAMLCVRPSGVSSPFYNAVPDNLRWPMTVLATLAAVVASQAMITGLFTMLTQAHALRLVPRIRVLHTNPGEQGQVYIPEVNWALCAVCVVLCLAFRTSAALSGAYGIAVTCTFVVTTLLLSLVLRRAWRWRWPAVLVVIVPMLFVDVAICSSNLTKIAESGWVPVLIAAVICLAMHTHHWGHRHEEEVFEEEAKAEEAAMAVPGSWGVDLLSFPLVSSVPGLLHLLRTRPLPRTPTAAVFMTSLPWRVPPAVGMVADMLGCLPQAIVLLNVRFEDVPFVAEASRSSFGALGEGLFSIVLRFGYAEPITAARLGVRAAIARVATEEAGQHPALRQLLGWAAAPGGDAELGAPGGRTAGPPQGPAIVLHRLVYAARPGRGLWTKMRIAMYSFIALNGRKAISFFGLESGRTMELSVVRFL